jgi:molybdate transport system substrate-binding protein
MTSWRRSRTVLARSASATLLIAVAACGAATSGTREVAGSSEAADRPPSTSAPLSGHITVFAAASLRLPFTAIGKQVEAAHPGTRIRFSFAGSSDLVAQLQGGAAADVFASADTATMDKVDGLHRAPVTFATNTLEIAVPPDNPAHVTALGDLARPGLNVVVCAPQVPCGAAAAKVEAAAEIDIRPVSEEQSVTDVLGKVTAGEADAGLVYLTDIKAAAGRVRGIPFRESRTAVNSYPIAQLEEAPNPALAAAFIQAVLDKAGQAILASAGFGEAP